MSALETMSDEDIAKVHYHWESGDYDDIANIFGVLCFHAGLADSNGNWLGAKHDPDEDEDDSDDEAELRADEARAADQYGGFCD